MGQRLEAYGRFGVHLGLERIQTLLAALGNPQAQVPLIHVAGTNGKGSVCAYLSAVLTQAGYRVGRYTSPHLVSWCERICLNDVPIAPTALAATLDTVEAAIQPDTETPTQFEVFTAAAWQYFAAQRVDLAVMEVGLGGRLDATNVCDRPLVSILVSLSREHWQRLGPTLADIAREKAGVLKAGCPAVIGHLPPEADAVVTERLQALGCPTVRPAPLAVTTDGRYCYRSLPSGDTLHLDQLPFPGQHQLMNAAIAIAALHCLRQQGWTLSDDAIQQGLAQARWPGRLQWLTWGSHRLLVDGAHNPAAAAVLRQYLDGVIAASPDAPSTVTWLMGILATKDHADIFKALLRPGDRLHLVPVPGHQSAETRELQAIAQTVCPELTQCQCHGDLAAGLQAAVQDGAALTVLCGSLYLIGHFFQTQAAQIA